MSKMAIRASAVCAVAAERHIGAKNVSANPRPEINQRRVELGHTV